MNLSLSRSSSATASWPDEQAERTIVSIAGGLSPHGGCVDLILVDDDAIRRINREFRGIDRATDVLSFSFPDDDPHPERDNLIGEVYVSQQTLEKEAKDQGVKLGHLFLRISVHGLLHVMGHDHQTEPEAVRMETEEKKLLSDHLPARVLETLF